MSSPTSLKKYALLSIGAAILTIVLKGIAWWMTGSVGLLSDALESVVNLAGALMALAMISVAEKPADAEHPYGHGKAEYFSSGFEGFLILLAAVIICVSSVERLANPQPIEQLDFGVGVSVVATVINLLTARVLLSVGRKYRSLTLKADAQHLMTDVWTTVGVIVGIITVSVTGWLWLDPVIAILVALNILYTGWRLLVRSTQGLMDVALPPEEQALITGILDEQRSLGVKFHAIRMRESGMHRFVEFHMLVPGLWTVQKGHDLAELLEKAIQNALPQTSVLIHIEPLGDPAAESDH